MAADARRCARATVEYDGTAFAGSQVQPNARTVQGELEEALNRLIGERIRVRLAGRTDAGVHATGQVAAFCLPRELPWRGGLPELGRRLNGLLPADLAVRGLRPVPSAFDPRRDALWRVYRYRIRTGPVRPLDRHRTAAVDERLDVDAMREAAGRLVGERDFAALGSHPRGRTVRNLAEVRVTRRGGLVEVKVTANAFLRRMVRSIVAVLLEVGRGRLTPDAAVALLDRPGRALHGRAAPARGLTLERIVYPSATTTTSSTDEREPGPAAPRGARGTQGRTGEQGT
jgi:tRNA pseudouridine38-40 synthase